MVRVAVVPSLVVAAHSGLDAYAVALSRTQYALVWLAIALLYFLNGLFCSAYAFFYLVATLFKNGYYIEFLNAMPHSRMPLVVAAYALAALFFWSRLVQIVLYSLRQRGFALQIGAKGFESGSGRPSQKSLAIVPSSPRLDLLPRPLQPLSERVAEGWRVGFRLWAWLWSADGLISVDGPLYELLLLAREVVEVALQSYQVNKASRLILQPWINRAFVGCLVLNCWLSPLVHSLTARTSRQAQRRWLYLWTDVVLDFASGLALPALVMLNLLRVLWLPQQQLTLVFDAPLDDVLLMDMVLSAKQLVVADFLDVFAKLLPIYSMGKYLDTIRRLARCKRAAGLAPSPATRRRASSSPTARPRKSRARPPSGAVVLPPPRHPRVQRHMPLVHRVSSLLHWLLLVWGVVMIVCHVAAHVLSIRAEHAIRDGCKASVSPWFERRFACSVMEINCFRRGIQGSAGQIDALLAQLAPSALVSLIITHCPALEMPARVATLTSLVGLELTNVSVVAWDATAALRSPNHDGMNFLSLVRTDLVTLPLGLRSAAFPKNLRSVQISVSRLSSLPEDLHLQWKRMLNVYVEHSQLHDVPATLASMDVDRLSLLGNQLTTVPDELFCANAFTVLSLAKNAGLTALPQCIGSLAGLQTLVLDGTNLSALPTWLINHTENHTIAVSLGGTPLCRTALEHANGSLLQAQSSLAGGGSGRLTVSCRERPAQEIEAYALTQNKRDREL